MFSKVFLSLSISLYIIQTHILNTTEEFPKYITIIKKVKPQKECVSLISVLKVFNTLTIQIKVIEKVIQWFDKLIVYLIHMAEGKYSLNNIVISIFEYVVIKLVN